MLLKYCEEVVQLLDPLLVKINLSETKTNCEPELLVLVFQDIKDHVIHLRLLVRHVLDVLRHGV